MRSRRWLPGFLLLALLACAKPQPKLESAPWVPEPAGDLGPVVAQVGDIPIFAAEVGGQAKQTGKPVAQALEDLIAFHLLAEKARQSLNGNFNVDRSAMKNIFVQRLMEREFESSIQPSNMTDEDLRPAYEKMRSNYVHPRLVEIGVQSLYPGPRMKPEARARVTAAAMKFKTYLETHHPATLDEFHALARDSSMSNEKLAWGRQWQGPDSPFTAKLGGEVMKLHHPNEMTPLVEDEMGFHVAMYIAELPPKNVSLEEARDELREHYYPYWRTARFNEFVQKLSATHKVEVFPDRMK